MKFFGYLFVLLVRIAFSATVEEVEELEFDLLEVNSLLESIVPSETSTQVSETVTTAEPETSSGTATTPVPEQPTNWCAWFEEIDFRIGAYKVLENNQEIRLGFYNTPISIIIEFLSEKSNHPVSRDDLMTAAGNLVMDEWSQGVLERMVRGVRPWLKSSNPQVLRLRTVLFTALGDLSTKTDMDRLKGILGKFILILEESRAQAQLTMINDKADRLNLIEEVKANAGPVRACLEHHLKIVGDQRLKFAQRLVHMETVMGRAQVIREKVGQRIEQAAKTSSLDLTVERTVKLACAESVNRIVFSEKRGISTELQNELTLIAHNHNFRTLPPILPVYLRAVDDIRAKLKEKQDKLAPALTRKRDECDRFIGETRNILSQLELYIKQ